MRYLFFILFTCVCFSANAQPELKPDARKIYDAYVEYRKEPHAPEHQMRFVRDFPASKEVFLKVFYPDGLDELYATRAEYMKTLQEIAVPFPKVVLPKITPIVIGMKSAGDIVGQLQNLIIDLAIKETSTFSETLHKLKKKEVASIASFLSDNPRYNELLNALRQVNDTKMLSIFTAVNNQKQ